MPKKYKKIRFKLKKQYINKISKIKQVFYKNT